MGNHAMRYIKTLTMAQKLEIRDFYFGGLDQYRMAANSDHSRARLIRPNNRFARTTLIFNGASWSMAAKIFTSINFPTA